jgi:acetylglutamate kinase
MTAPVVLKLGGELLESPADRDRTADAAAAWAAAGPLVVVHGGGRAIDAALDRQGLTPKKVDGLRVTDRATLDVVVAVLAGLANTQLVAALVGRGVRAVGLTGVDAALGRAVRSHAHRRADGTVVDLGLVGDPVEPDAGLIEVLLGRGYVPVVASLGVDLDGDGGRARGGSVLPDVLNVNADVMACRLAGALSASDLVIAGTTPGVLDANGAAIADLDADAVDDLIAGGTATAGMVAKLRACQAALADGVARVRIVDGRALGRAREIGAATGTSIRAAAPAGTTR